MLKTISVSSNKKLGGCAATYRSGSHNVYSTCPSTCALKPAGTPGSSKLDPEYLAAVYDAVPKGGVSWTYTHFTDEESLKAYPVPESGKTVINLSSDTVTEAISSYLDGYPTVVSVPKEMDSKVDYIGAGYERVRFVRCPAEYNDKVTCRNCGGGLPLCARPDRNYVIKFTAHGTQAKKVGSTEPGGCYGSGGPVAIQWKRTMNDVQEVSDAQKLTEWVRSLPHGTFLRHHVVGDLG